MKTMPRQALTLLTVSGLGVSLLTACPRDPVPSQASAQLNFQFPALTDTGDVKVAAVAFLTPNDEPKVVASGSLTSNTTASIWLWGEDLKTLAANSRCTTPFLTGEAAGKVDVTVTPQTAKTCNVYFLVYRDSDRNGQPTSLEELYNTHDLYSYASESFSYRFLSPDGNSTETGTRTAGWSLVRHQVLQPSATPGRYLVSMNSVPKEDEALTLRMHEPTNFFTSQGLTRTGGHK